GQERRERHAPALPVSLRGVLGLHPRDVHVARAFALAGLAREAPVERTDRLRVVPDWLAGALMAGDLSGHGEPERVGAAAGGVAFVHGGHVRRTHGSAGAGTFAADAGAVAHLGGAVEAVLVAEVEVGGDTGFVACSTGVDAEVVGDGID